MKILQLIPNLLSGGAESFTKELTVELCRKGHECNVLSLFDILEENVKTKELRNITKLDSLHKKFGLDIGCFWRLYKYIKSEGYDVVHAHVNAIPYILLSCLLLKKIKFVATIHSDASFEAGNNVMKWIRMFLFKTKLCTPVTISNESLVSFEKFYGLSAPMVYNGVSKYSDEGMLSLRDNDEQLLFVHPASCQEVKNQRLLLLAFAELVKTTPNVKLIWVGANASNKVLFEDLKKIMVKQIKYIGVVPNVRAYLAQADAMCLSSKLEGMPMSVIEAFSVGCPTLCTPVGGILNMVDNGKNGLLSKDLTVDSYFKMLKSFVNLSIEDRNNMRNEAKQSFEKFNISICADNYINIYKDKKK